jgi:hypothetical protein
MLMLFALPCSFNFLPRCNHKQMRIVIVEGHGLAVLLWHGAPSDFYLQSVSVCKKEEQKCALRMSKLQKVCRRAYYLQHVLSR